MNIRTRKAAVAVIIAAALPAAACGGSSGNSTASGSSSSAKLVPFSYRTDYLPNGFYAAIVYAEQQGYYKDEGLDFDFRYGKGSPTTVQDVAAGRTDAGDASSSTVAIAVGKGTPVVSVGAMTAKFQFGFFVPTDSSIHSLKDLAGKTVVAPAATPQTQLYPALWKIAGIDGNSVTVLAVAPSAAITTYDRGTGDAIGEAIPFGAPQIQPQRPSRVIAWADEGLVVPDYSFIVNQDLLKNHPDRVAAFLRATYRGVTQAYAHPQAAIDAYATFEKSVPRDVIEQQFTTYKNFYCTDAMTKANQPIGFQNASDWTTGLDTLKQYEGLDQSVTMQTVATNKFFQAPYNVSKTSCPLQ